MALRATYGDTSSAVAWIINKREEKRQIKQQEKEDRARRKLQKQLGNCDNGIPVITFEHSKVKVKISPLMNLCCKQSLILTNIGQCKSIYANEGNGLQSHSCDGSFKKSQQ